MSHVSTVETVVKSLPAMAKACGEVGAEFREGQQTFEWFGRWMDDYHDADAAYKNGIKPEDYGKCDHAVHVPGAKYEVGLVSQPDGSFNLVYDGWGPGGLHQKLGKGIETLRQAYAVEVVREQVLMQGLDIASESTLEDGSVVFEMNANA